MLVKEIIRMCGNLCDLQLPKRCDVNVTDIGAEDNETIKRLILCCNHVLEELYAQFTAIATCDVTAKSGVIDTSELPFDRVLKLTDKQGKDIPFRYKANGLSTEDGDYVLTYAQRHKTVSWSSPVVLPSPRVTERVLIYGMLYEYFFLTEDFKLAEVWKTRFRDALRAASLKTTSMTLPVGKWL